MCGRYAATKDPGTLAVEFDAVDATGGQAPEPDYNVAPTKPVLSVVQRHPRREDGSINPATTERSIRVMRWGLVPGWAKDPSVGSRLINARAESAAEKPAYRTAMAKRRCLLPADGWFEWQRDGRHRQAYFLTPEDGSSVALAGIWSVWRPHDAAEDEPPLITCAVLTTDAVGPLKEIHDRMPLVLPADGWASWLDPDAEAPAELLRSPPDLVRRLELRPISDAVNDVGRNGPELLERVELPAHTPALLGLS